jgi:predicted RNA-binding Zn ribbon-like protein
VLVRDLDAATLLAVRLINSYDMYELDPELLPTTGALRRLLSESGFAKTEAPMTRDVSDARALRNVLRQVFEPRPLRTKVRALNELLERAPIHPLVVSGGRDWEIAYDVSDQAKLGRRLAVVCALGLAAAVRRYGHERLKVCAAAPCQNVFIDLSKNLVRRHCSRRCANRVSAAAFRARGGRATALQR